jgi:hypothetical protein
MDKKTISDLYQHEYPLLQAAHAHSYQDFGSSETDSKTEQVLFSSPLGRYVPNNGSKIGSVLGAWGSAFLIELTKR